MVRVESENDIERLRAYTQCVEHECELLRRRVAELVDRLAKAEGIEQQELLAAELAMLNGTSKADGHGDHLAGRSERRRPEHENTDKKKKPQTGHGPTEQPDLDVVEKVLELDEADKICPDCGGELVEIEGQFEASELIDVIDVRYQIRKVKRQKYRCTCPECQHIDTALPAQDRLMEGGRYSVRFAVHIIEQKYMMHLPLARQVRQMKLADLKITSQTLWDQLWHVAFVMEPSWEALRRLILEQDVIGADETRWRLLNRKKPAKPQIIGLTSEVGIYYAFEMDKTAETVSEILGDFGGWLIVDGISIYPAVRTVHHDGFINGTRDHPPFRIANCWAHARRYFIDAEPDFAAAGQMLDLIAKLYRVVPAAWSEDVDQNVRREWIEVLLGAMRNWMEQTRPPPGTSLAKAIEYTSNHWRGLTRFVDHPEVWLDNNATERALRSPILGRRNHYGSKSKRGMKAAAIFYSLIETCRLLGVNPRDYLLQAVRHVTQAPGSVFLPHELLEN